MATVSGLTKLFEWRTFPTKSTLNQGVAFLKPNAVSSGQYQVRAIATDGCNIVYKDITVNVDVDACPVRPVANLTQSVRLNMNNLMTSTQVTLDGSSSTTASCLPSDYFKTPWAGSGLGYKRRYSPYYGETGKSQDLAFHNRPPLSPDNLEQTGCTWPGATNFEPSANAESGACTCPEPVYYWDITECRRGNRTLGDASACLTKMERCDNSYTYEVYDELKQSSTTPGSCSWMAHSNTTASRTLLLRKLTQALDMPEVLKRPSTSYGAHVSYKVNTDYHRSWNTTNTATTVTGKDVLACTWTVDTPMKKNAHAEIKPETHMQRCLGDYTFRLAMWDRETWFNSSYMEDKYTVSVVCPDVGYPSILAPVNQTQDDKFNFVGDRSDKSTWIYLDGRLTFSPYRLNDKTNNSVVQFKVVSEPAMLTYPGAGPTGGVTVGPTAPPADLNEKYEIVTNYGNQNYTGYFRPTRGGQYLVSMSIDDGCNYPVSAVTGVTAFCRKLALKPNSVDNLITYDSSRMEFTLKSPINMIMADANTDTTVSYAWRVTKRPSLKYGDTFGNSGSSIGMPSGTSSYECNLDSNWNTISLSNHDWDQDITFTAQLQGDYTFQLMVTDGCTMQTQTSSSKTASCSGITAFDTSNVQLYFGSDYSSSNTYRFKSGSFGTFTWANTPSSTGTPFSTPVTNTLYLKSAPAGFTGRVNYAPLATPSYQCSKGNSFSGVTELGASASSMAASNPFLTSPGTFAFTGLVPGQYTFAMQGTDKCGNLANDISVTLQCNNPARFTCADGTSRSGSCSSAGVDYTYAAPSNPSFHCFNKRYDQVFVSSLSDGGSDMDSDKDTVTTTVTLTPPAKSWLGTKYAQVDFSFELWVNDSTLLHDGPNYYQISNQTQSKIAATVKSIMDNGAGSVFDQARVLTQDYDFFVRATPSSCYSVNWGRVFTVTGRFGIAAPQQFRPFADPVVPNTNPDIPVIDTTYMMDVSDTSKLDLRPFDIFVAALSAGAQTFYAGIVPAGTQVYSSAIGTSSTYTPKSNSFATKQVSTSNVVWAIVSEVKDKSAPQPDVTSFLPDIPGTYSVQIGIVDNCPGTSSSPSVTQTVTVGSWSCQASAFTPSVSIATEASTLDWRGKRAMKPFGTVNVTSAAADNRNYTELDLSPSDFSTPSSCSAASTGVSCNLNPSSGSTAATSISYNFPSGANQNGGSVQFSVPTSTGPEGSEIFVSCGTQVVAVVPKTGLSGYVLDFPSSCSQLTWTQKAANGTTAATAWSVNVMHVVTKPGSSYPSIFCNPSFVVTSTDPAPHPVTGTAKLYSINDIMVGTPVDGKFDPQAPMTYDTTGNGVQAQYNVLATVSYSVWPWMDTCSKSSSASNYNVKCPAWKPTFKGTVVGTPTSNFQNNMIQVAVEVDQTAYLNTWKRNISDVMNSGMWVTGAPAGSVFNAQYLVDKYLNAHEAMINSDFANTSWWGRYDDMWSYWQNMDTQMSYTSNSWVTASTMNQIDVSSVSYQLIPADMTQDGEDVDYVKNMLVPYWAHYVEESWLLYKRMHAFLFADAAGSYSFSAEITDGCQRWKSTSSASVSCTQAAIAFVNGATQTSTGLKRISIPTTLDGEARLVGDGKVSRAVHWEFISTPAMPAHANVPTIMNWKTLNPSFVPTVGGTYVVRVWVYDGCVKNGMMNYADVTITVSCPAPTLSGDLYSVNSYSRVGNSALTVMAEQGTGSVFQPVMAVGEPSCPSFKSGYMDTVDFTCPEPYTVSVKGVWPTVLSKVQGATVQLIVNVAGFTGLPPSITSWNKGDRTALVVTIDGKNCDNVQVVDANAGRVTCESPDLTGYSNGQKVKVVAVVQGQTSDPVANGFTTVSDPYVTGQIGSAPTVGGTRVTLTGVNLAFAAGMHKAYNPAYAMWNTVKINGQDCGNVAARVVRAGSWSDPDVRLECDLPPGVGGGLPVDVTVQYMDNSDPLRPVPAGAAVSGQKRWVFDYDAAQVTKLYQSSGLGQGNYTVRMEVRNFGPKIQRPIADALAYQMSGNAVEVYGGITIWVNDRMVDISTLRVLSDETPSKPAIVEFSMIDGCGSMVPVIVDRYHKSGVVGELWSYDNPVVTCVGEPFSESEEYGCPRINIDGANFGALSDNLQISVNFLVASNGTRAAACEDIRVDPTAPYRRLSCRLPSNVRPGMKVEIVNRCEQSNWSGFQPTPSPSPIPAPSQSPSSTPAPASASPSPAAGNTTASPMPTPSPSANHSTPVNETRFLSFDVSASTYLFGASNLNELPSLPDAVRVVGCGAAFKTNNGAYSYDVSLFVSLDA